HLDQLPRHPQARLHEQRGYLVEGRGPAADDLRAWHRQLPRQQLPRCGGFSPGGAGGVLAAVSTTGIIFALLGFEQADQLAGESANPKRDIPRAVIGAICIGAIIYILLQVVFIGALPAKEIGTTWANGGYTAFSGPFAQLATLVGAAGLATILYIDAVISPGGTALIYVTGTSRVSYGLSRNG